LNYEIRENFEESLGQGEILNFSDTTLTTRLDEAFYFTYDFRIGMEWFKPEKATTMVYGLDVFVGIENEKDGYRIIPEYLTEGILVPSPFVAAYRYEQEIQFLIAGFDFSIGHKFNASEKVNFIVRWTPQFAYRTPISERYSDLTFRENPAVSTVVFRLRGIEVYLNYQF
jgi:hypothetical protein